MEEIIQITFPNPWNDEDIVRFIPNENLTRLYEGDKRRNSRQDAIFDE
jgi:hypothetical protein